MARTSRTPEPAAPTAMVASAVRIVGNVKESKTPKSKGWQDKAWYFFDTIGEFQFAANWVGNLLSRAVLFAGRDVGNGLVQVPPDSVADEVLDEFFGDSAGRSQMLHDIGVAYTVAGECFIVGYEDEDGDQIYTVTSPTDLKRQGGKWKLNGEDLPDDALVIRLWRPHPRKRLEATSPARAALPILQEIEYLTQRINAEITSRLTGAGVLWIPSEIASAATTTTNPDGTQTTGISAAAFSKVLQETMGTAIADRSDASAMVPIVVTADGAFIDKVTLTKFWSEMDSELLSLREAATKRLALSLDMPPEILTGMGEANHWSAWQVDESAIKSHSEPLLRAITNDITKGYLRPALHGLVPENEEREYGVGADTSEMRLRPNRSKEALELWDRGVLKEDTLRRETGFSVDDKPTKVESKLWLTRKIASGSATPEMVNEAARLLGLDLGPIVQQAVEDANESRPAPSLLEHPVREIPESASVDRALLMASEVLVFRAMERAGNRLRTKSGVKFSDVGASEVYLFVPCASPVVDDVMVDAWSNVDRFAPDLGVTTESLTECLDGYCRVLLSTQIPHDRDLLAQHLSRATSHLTLVRA